MPLIVYRPFPRFIRHLIYRIRHGFWPSETWNLDHEFAEWLLPRLKYYRANLHCCGPFETIEEWEEVLDRMIEGFELKLLEWEEDHFLSQEDAVKIEEAFRFFGDYGQNLWD